MISKYIQTINQVRIRHPNLTQIMCSRYISLSYEINYTNWKICLENTRDGGVLRRLFRAFSPWL